MSTKDYATKDIVVTFDAARCIHAAECVHGAPDVFDPTARPWIRLENADAEYVAEVVRRCPTGALTARRPDGTAIETPDADNNLRVVADGPLYLRGRVVYEGGQHANQVEYTRVALCRCGASNNKPFCDNSHTNVGFKDAGACSGKPADANAGIPRGAVAIKPIDNGPLMLQGFIEFKAADGTAFVAGEKTWLCRCGQSANKPFCDGTHKKVGFTG